MMIDNVFLKLEVIYDDMLKYEMSPLLYSHELYKEKLIGQYDLQFVMMQEVEEAFVLLLEKLQDSLSY